MVNKTISLKEEVHNKLKEVENASKLINDLLEEYFNEVGGLKKKELKDKINNTKIEITNLNDNLKKMEENLEKISNEEKRINETFKEIPHEIMEDFRFFKKMDLEGLKSRYNTIYRHKYKDLTYEELENAFKEIRGLKDEEYI